MQSVAFLKPQHDLLLPLHPILAYKGPVKFYLQIHKTGAASLRAPEGSSSDSTASLLLTKSLWNNARRPGMNAFLIEFCPCMQYRTFLELLFKWDGPHSFLWSMRCWHQRHRPPTIQRQPLWSGVSLT